MKISFNSRGYEVPEPVPTATEVMIRPERMVEIPGHKNPTEKVFRVSNPVRKFLFFLLHEGPKLTFCKARATFLTRKILGQQKVLFAIGKIENTTEYAIGVGPQFCHLSELLVFPRECTMIVSKTWDIENDYRLILTHFRDNPKALESLAAYSPFSGVPLEFNLEEILGASKHSSSDVGFLRRESTEWLQFPEAPKTPVVTMLKKKHDGEFELFLAGAGVYAYSYILPAISTRNVHPHTIIDLNPILASYIAEKYGFPFRDTSTGRALQRLRDIEKPLLIIATYHSTHVAIAEEAYAINPRTRIFIEKPPATTLDQLERLLTLRRGGAFIEIGYNRRYIPFTARARQLLSRKSGPTTVTCIVREKSNLPLSHWYYWPTQGTRVTGNLAHWIDLGYHFIGKKPISLLCHTGSAEFVADEPVISILFEDNSLLNIIATDKGDTLRGIQEYIDIRREDLTIQIDDFLSMRVYEAGASRTFRRIIRDKGHTRMYKTFVKACETGTKPLYPDRDLYVTTKLYLDIKDALLSKQRGVDLFGYGV